MSECRCYSAGAHQRYPKVVTLSFLHCCRYLISQHLLAKHQCRSRPSCSDCAASGGNEQTRAKVMIHLGECHRLDDTSTAAFGSLDPPSHRGCLINASSCRARARKGKLASFVRPLTRFLADTCALLPTRERQHSAQRPCSHRRLGWQLRFLTVVPHTWHCFAGARCIAMPGSKLAMPKECSQVQSSLTVTVQVQLPCSQAARKGKNKRRMHGKHGCFT